MIVLPVLLLMFIDNTECIKNNESSYPTPYTIYRLSTPSNASNKVILVNFFGRPGIEVLHETNNYVDVKIPIMYNNTFTNLAIFKNKTDIKVLKNKEYDYGVIPSGRKGYLIEDRDEPVGEGGFDENYFTDPFRHFLEYASIVEYLKSMNKKHPKRIHLLSLGTTINNRPIYAVAINSSVINATSVFIEGGTIAREWTSITMALYVIKEIGTNIAAYPTLKNLAWIIVPVVNPDGYQFSRNPKVNAISFRLWMKNRNCPKECKIGSCGVNLNRNFPHYSAGIGASLSPCSNLYMGPSALSERESRYIQSIMMANRDTLKLYIGLRNFGSYILYPWGLKAEEIFDAQELVRVAQAAVDAMYDIHNGKLENYTIGNYATIKYPAAGNMMDFARGVMDIKYSYVIFLRNGSKAYEPEQKEIVPIIKECFQEVITLLQNKYLNKKTVKMLMKTIPVNILIVASFIILKILDDLPEVSTETLDFFRSVDIAEVKSLAVRMQQDDNSVEDYYSYPIEEGSTHFKYRKPKKKEHNFCFCNPKKREKYCSKFCDILTKFWPYSKIENYLKYMADTYPNRTRLQSLSKTSENRNIYAMKIGVGMEGNNVVFIEAGLHSKEWGSIMMALYIIYALLECDLLEKIGSIDWIIMPVINPDGYVYSFNNPKHRMWNKNRRSCKGHEKCKGKCGVDLNKNFHAFFGKGFGSDPCSNFYEGPQAASETETNVTENLLKNLTDRVKLYLGIHTYGALILYPNANSNATVTNVAELAALARYAVDVINKHKNTNDSYTLGNYAEAVVPESGTSLDFAKNSLNIQYTYYINLRESRRMNDKDILPTVTECFYGICAMVHEINKMYAIPKQSLRQWEGYHRRRRQSDSAENASISCYVLGAAIAFYYVTG